MKTRLSGFIMVLFIAFMAQCSRPAGLKLKFKGLEWSETSQEPGSSVSSAYALVDADTLEVVDQLNAGVPMIPASTTKVLTMAAALRLLGNNHRFYTSLSYRGEITGGDLNGDLVLKGGGDPTLKIRHLLTMVEQLEKLKIKKVKGRFIIDESFLAYEKQIDDDMNIDAHYNQALGALSVNYNVSLLRWHYDWRAKRYKYILTPELDNIKLKVSGQPFVEPRRFKYQYKDKIETWYHASDFRRHAHSYSRYLPARQPGLFTGSILRLLAAQAGIELPEPTRAIISGSRTRIARFKSPTLLFIAEAVLDYSSNLLADTLLLHIGKKLAGKNVSLQEAARLLKEYLVTNIKMPHWQGFELANGSGLTTANRISPLQMIAVLKWAAGRDYQGRSFKSLLPISGTKGSMANRLYSNNHAYRVFAKTGAISYAVALAGVLKNKNGSDYIFACFYRDQAKRDYISNHDNAHAARLRRLGPGWGAGRRNAIEQQVKNWLDADLTGPEGGGENQEK